MLLQVLRENMPQESRELSYPKVLLTTASGELHFFGLLMAQFILILKGARVYSFGPQLPVAEIAQAVKEKQIDIVALSFSASFPVAKMREFLRDLAAVLPSRVEVWIGGAAGQKYQSKSKNFLVISCLEEIEKAMDSWKSQKNQ
jgi:cobalamin-dependent methionine synthase I